MNPFNWISFFFLYFYALNYINSFKISLLRLSLSLSLSLSSAPCKFFPLITVAVTPLRQNGVMDGTSLCRAICELIRPG